MTCSPHPCRYGENWYGPGWAPGELFRPSRDVCAMPFSATDVRLEALQTYANVTVGAGYLVARLYLKRPCRHRGVLAGGT